MQTNQLANRLWLLLLSLYPYMAFPSQFSIRGTVEHWIPCESKILETEENYERYEKIWMGIRLLMPQKNPEIRIGVKGIGESFRGTRNFSLNDTNSLSLPKGTYKVECLTHDIFWGERYHEAVFVKNDQLLHVPCGWFAVNENNRFLQMYCFEKGSLVNVVGKVVDECGNGLSNVSIVCSLQLENDRIFWDKVETNADKKGEFVIRNLPPASIDRTVYFLLYGNPRYGRSFGIGLLYADLQIGMGELKSNKRICLVSERNLANIRPLAARIRSYGPIGGVKGFQYVDEDWALREFPISTNNIIYVGDIVLPEKSENKD